MTKYVDEGSFGVAVESLLIAACYLTDGRGLLIPRTLDGPTAEKAVLSALQAEHRPTDNAEHGTAPQAAP